MDNIIPHKDMFIVFNYYFNYYYYHRKIEGVTVVTLKKSLVMKFYGI